MESVLNLLPLKATKLFHFKNFFFRKSLIFFVFLSVLCTLLNHGRNEFYFVVRSIFSPILVLQFLPSFCNISSIAQFKRKLPCWEYNMFFKGKRKTCFRCRTFFKNSKHVRYNCTKKNIRKKIINHKTIFLV